MASLLFAIALGSFSLKSRRIFNPIRGLIEKVLAYENDGDLIYIARSNSVAFHVIYRGTDMGSHTSIRLAIDSASSEFMNTGLRKIVGRMPLNGYIDITPQPSMREDRKD